MIIVDNVTKSYGEHEILHSVNLQVAQGVVFALLGPNGAGKTTLISILTSLLLPSTGHVTIDGWDVAKSPTHARERIGVVFQDPSLDELLTVRENLDLHCALYRVKRRLRPERIAQALRDFDLAARQDSRVQTLSGGMRRRLELARTFLHRPSVLFLDEPTVGLDTLTRHHFWSQVKALNAEEGTTVLFTTHYIEEAESAAHQVAIINGGTIAARGSVDDIKEAAAAESLEQAFLRLTRPDTREP